MKFRTVIFSSKYESSGKEAPLFQFALDRKCINLGLSIRTSLNISFTQIFINLTNFMEMHGLVTVLHNVRHKGYSQHTLLQSTNS